MSDDESAMITPPPGIDVPKPQQREPHSETAQADPDAFITLPPGVVDSGTYRVANPRVVPQRSSSDDIVFFPTGPGAPAAPVAPVAPVVAPNSAEVVPSVAIDQPAPPHSAAPQSAAPQWRLVLPGGIGARAVEGALFIGRNPARTVERPDAELLPLVDPAKSLSKTHALVELDGGQLWVHDLDSTNGVFVVPDEGDAIEVEPGTRAAVPAGADLELGDYVIRVERS